MDLPKALQLNWHLLVFPTETSNVQIPHPPPPKKNKKTHCNYHKKKSTWIFKKCLEGLLIGRYIFIKNILGKAETLGPLSCFQSEAFMQSWQANSSIMSCSLYTITSLYEIYHQFCQLAEIYIILFEKKEVQLSHRLLVT